MYTLNWTSVFSKINGTHRTSNIPFDFPPKGVPSDAKVKIILPVYNHVPFDLTNAWNLYIYI